MDSIKKVYTVPDIMQLLGISRRSVTNLLTGGKIKAKKVAGKWIVTESNLSQFLEATTN